MHLHFKWYSWSQAFFHCLFSHRAVHFATGIALETLWLCSISPHVLNHCCLGGGGVVFHSLNAIRKNHELSDYYFSFFFSPKMLRVMNVLNLTPPKMQGNRTSIYKNKNTNCPQHSRIIRKLNHSPRNQLLRSEHALTAWGGMGWHKASL